LVILLGVYPSFLMNAAAPSIKSLLMIINAG